MKRWKSIFKTYFSYIRGIIYQFCLLGKFKQIYVEIISFLRKQNCAGLNELSKVIPLVKNRARLSSTAVAILKSVAPLLMFLR